MVQGFEAKVQRREEQSAWLASHLLIAAGCDAEKVTPGRLLGYPEPRRSIKQRIARDPEVLKQKSVERVMAKMRAQRETQAATPPEE